MLPTLLELDADSWIAFFALIVAIASFVHSAVTSRRLTRLQVRVAEYELKAHQAKEEWTRRADLRLRIEKHPDRFILSNEGGAVAREVWLEIRSHGGPRQEAGRNPIEIATRHKKLPIAMLDSAGECEFDAAIYRQYESAFDYVITWRDPDGSEQRIESTLHT